MLRPPPRPRGERDVDGREVRDLRPEFEPAVLSVPFDDEDREHQAEEDDKHNPAQRDESVCPQHQNQQSEQTKHHAADDSVDVAPEGPRALTNQPLLSMKPRRISIPSALDAPAGKLSEDSSADCRYLGVPSLPVRSCICTPRIQTTTDVKVLQTRTVW